MSDDLEKRLWDRLSEFAIEAGLALTPEERAEMAQRIAEDPEALTYRREGNYVSLELDGREFLRVHVMTLTRTDEPELS